MNEKKAEEKAAPEVSKETEYSVNVDFKTILGNSSGFSLSAMFGDSTKKGETYLISIFQYSCPIFIKKIPLNIPYQIHNALVKHCLALTLKVLTMSGTKMKDRISLSSKQLWQHRMLFMIMLQFHINLPMEL